MTLLKIAWRLEELLDEMIGTDFDLFPRPVGGAKPNALVRILEKHSSGAFVLPERGPIRTSFACTYPVRRRTTGSIFRKAVAETSAAAFRFSPLLRPISRPPETCRQAFAQPPTRH